MIRLVALIIINLLAPAPNRTLYKSETARADMAAMYVEAGAFYGIDPADLTYWSFRESSFRIGVVADSDLKEFGLMQVHGVTRFLCKNELKRHKETLETARGQIMCGAYLIRRYIDRCGSLKSALGMYASGRCGYAQKLVNARLATADRLRRCYATDDLQTVDRRPWEEGE